MLKHKAFFDKTTKNITALIFGLINVNEIIFYTTKAQKFFLLTKFSCFKITTVFSRQLISMRLHNRTKSTLQCGSEHTLLHFRSPFNLIEIITSIWSILPGFNTIFFTKHQWANSRHPLFIISVRLINATPERWLINKHTYHNFDTLLSDAIPVLISLKLYPEYNLSRSYISSYQESHQNNLIEL